MLNRLRRHLTPPMVVAVIALLVALGGGYATAFTGSGSLQKGAKFDIPLIPTPVRSLTGVGNVLASCQVGAIDVRIQNNRTEQLRYGPHVVIPAGGNATPDLYSDAGGSADLQFHISPADADKTPQVNLLIRVDDTDDCATSAIYVLALNTQQ